MNKSICNITMFKKCTEEVACDMGRKFLRSGDSRLIDDDALLVIHSPKLPNHRRNSEGEIGNESDLIRT